MEGANPQQVLPILGIRKRVLFPSVLLRLTIGRHKSVSLVESLWDPVKQTFKKGAKVMVCAVSSDADGEIASEESESKDGSLETVEYDEGVRVFQVGTVARVLHLSRVKGGKGSSAKFSMLVEGVSRAKVSGVIVEQSDQSLTGSYPTGNVEWLRSNDSPNDTKVRALALNVKRSVNDLLEAQRARRMTARATQSFEKLKQTIEDAPSERLADVLVSNLDASLEEKQRILEDPELASRLQATLQLVTRQHQVLRLSQKIQDQVESRMKTTQREYLLRQQLKAIKQELQSINNKSQTRKATTDDPGSIDSPEESEGVQDDDDESGIRALQRSLEKANMPPTVQETAMRELKRLEQLQPAQPEYSVIRTYLECLADIPWSVSTTDNLDVVHAREQLDHDHFGLDKVKRRVVEFLAVRTLKNDMKGPILCLVGPPGVGKTSLGKSIAAALGREYRRIALGGVRDEAEIRGHRRTYIGAMPGNVVQALRKAGSNNPVLVLDEIDKLGRDVRGDPGAALLEVLDPEQNDSFTDHYLNVPLDLSKVLFIATANSLDTIPPPLRDRMEVIQVPGYTTSEKIQIASRHLLPKQLLRHGISDDFIQFEPEGWSYLLDGYTREAGVRNLDRQVAALCRHVAVKVAEEASKRGISVNAQTTESAPGEPSENQRSNGSGIVTTDSQSQHANDVMADHDGRPSSSDELNQQSSGEGTNHNMTVISKPQERTILEQLTGVLQPVVVDRELIVQVLGPHLYESEIAQRTSVPGVATGMAWTQVGGEILFVEASVHRGSGRLQLTGQLGKVMSESVRAAVSFVRAHLDELGLFHNLRGQFVDIEQELDRLDLHVHFPAGAVPKDGPSAGVAVCAAIVSALSGRCVRNDTACTGEITLRGLVLPVGGVKEKVLAAHRAGVKRVVLPERNEKDLVDIPAQVKEDLEFHFVGDILSAMHQLVPKREIGFSSGGSLHYEDEANSWHDRFRARNARRNRFTDVPLAPPRSQGTSSDEMNENHSNFQPVRGGVRPVVWSKM